MFCMFSNWFIDNFLQKDPLLVKVNKLTSTKTQLPYSYYSLPFCKPNMIVDSAENLGEVLRGDRIENSPYVVSTRLLLVTYSPL
jgi:transmembrane 9 superfamily member 2/4